MCHSQLEYTPELSVLKKPSFLPRLTKAWESWASPAHLCSLPPECAWMRLATSDLRGFAPGAFTLAPASLILCLWLIKLCFSFRSQPAVTFWELFPDRQAEISPVEPSSSLSACDWGCAALCTGVIWLFPVLECESSVCCYPLLCLQQHQDRVWPAVDLYWAFVRWVHTSETNSPN